MNHQPNQKFSFYFEYWIKTVRMDKSKKITCFLRDGTSKKICPLKSFQFFNEDKKFSTERKFPHETSFSKMSEEEILTLVIDNGSGMCQSWYFNSQISN